MVIVSAERWTDLIEQTTMLMMILGRWLLPTVQGMTKDSLSQLLLVNLAMCADIIEFFDILKLDFVKNSQTLIITILVLWTWSLMQFPFNTMSKIDEDDGTNDGKPKKGDKPSRGRRSIVPVGGDGSAAQIPSLKDRASMTSWDFKHAIAAKRISRDKLLMSHNYSRGLPPNYLPDFGRNSYQPRLGRTNGALGEDDLTSSSQTNATDSNKSNLSGFSRGPGRYSLDVGQMRPKRLKGHMTTSMTSPNLMLEASQHQRQIFFLNDNNANVPKSSLPVPETRIDIEETEEEKPTKSRITTELVAILMSLFMQDGPFLTFRLFIIARYQAYEYMVIFLTVKNALVLALQVYRLCVLHCTCYDHQENDFSPENQIDANSRLKNVQVAVTHKNEDQMEDKSFHESIPWTGIWRNSLRNPFHSSSRQAHLAS